MTIRSRFYPALLSVPVLISSAVMHQSVMAAVNEFVIKDIQVEGLRRTEAGTVFSQGKRPEPEEKVNLALLLSGPRCDVRAGCLMCAERSQKNLKIAPNLSLSSVFESYRCSECNCTSIELIEGISN